MMEISNWSLAQLMQLPDFVFGQRWPISIRCGQEGLGPFFEISDAGLGDRCVIWNVSYIYTPLVTSLARVHLSLGDQLPATLAEFDALEDLFPYLGHLGAARRRIIIPGGPPGISFPLRMPIDAQGRRLVGWFTRNADGNHEIMATIIISGVPRSIPSWLARTIVYDRKKV